MSPLFRTELLGHRGQVHCLSLHEDVDIADEAENERTDGRVFADPIALELAGGCSVRLDLVIACSERAEVVLDPFAGSATMHLPSKSGKVH
jgi:hypothetical protein